MAIPRQRFVAMWFEATHKDGVMAANFPLAAEQGWHHLALRVRMGQATVDTASVCHLDHAARVIEKIGLGGVCDA